MLFDDYGFSTCPSAKLAADEFLAGESEELLLLPTGQMFVIMSKKDPNEPSDHDSRQPS